MIYYKQAITDISQSKISQLYLLFGEELLLADELIRKIKTGFLEEPESELNYFSRYATETGIDEIIALSSGMGLFSDKKLLILKEADVLKTTEVDKLLKIVSKPIPDICLVLQTNKTNIKQTRLKKISDYFTMVNLVPLNVNDLKDFIKNEFSKYQKDVTREAMDLLIFLVGTQLTDIIIQVRNIADFFNQQKLIEVDHIEKIVSVYATHDVFELCRELGNENFERSSFILVNLIESGISPSYILSQILRHFTLIWQILGYRRVNIVQPQKLATSLNVYYKYIDEYIQQSKKWEFYRLIKVMEYISDADREIKNNNLESKLILDILNFKIINSKY
jgi:DNA polymerase-3 subunit delta